MYLLILIVIGIFVLVSLLDRSAVSLALIGMVVLLAMLVSKIRQLVNRIDGLENEITGLETRIEGLRARPPAADAEQTDSAGDRASAAATPAAGASAATPPETLAAEKPPAAPAAETPSAAPAAEDETDTGPEPLLPPASQPETGAAPLPGPAVPVYAAASSKPAPREATRPQSAAAGQDSARIASPQPNRLQHNWFDRMLKKFADAAWAWITGGNIFVRVGIIILFMGMTFLIRYAIGENLIPIELRLAAVGGVAVALLVWGWRQRDKKENFALVVQGGGIGLLYLTIFASFSLYRVLDSTPAFVMLGLIVILAALLSVLQNARSLALFAAVGGFLAPILTSSGSGNYIGLFSYYTALNLGIFAVAWFKSWRILNLTGFVFTFAISGTWGALSYEPEFFATTQPFLVIFFLLYVGISVLFALRRSVNFRDPIDGTLVFGTPLLAFAMQSELVGDFEYGIALSAFVLAAFYLCLSYLLWKKFPARLSLLCETFLSLAVIFATLAIPFAIDGSLTAPIWAIEGAGILWISIRQQQFYRRLFAVLLILAAGAIIGWEILFSGATLFQGKQAFFNSAFIGTTLIAIAAAAAAWLLSSPFAGRRALEAKLEYALLAYSSAVLLAGFEVQILQFELFRAHGHYLALLVTLAGLDYVIGAEKWKWKTAHWVALGYFSLLLPAALLAFLQQERLAENHGYLLWPPVMIALFYGLKKIRAVLTGTVAIAVHLAAAVLLAALLYWEGIWQLLLGYTLFGVLFCKLGARYDWPEFRLCSILLLPVLVLCFISALAFDDNLVELSSIGSEYYPPLAPGGFLWPAAFAAYFYLLFKNPEIGGRLLPYFYYAAAALIAVMLLWLGLWPLLLGATLLCWLAYYLGYRYRWREMRLLSKLLLPLMVLVPIVGLFNGIVDPVRLIAFNLDFRLAERSGFVLWPLAFVTHYLMLWLAQKANDPPAGFTHAASLLFVVAMLTWEISRLGLDLVPFFNAWHLVLLPIVGLFAIKSILDAGRWPFDRYREGFELYALPLLALGTVLWSLLQFRSSGVDSPLVWVPLLNPIDLMQCLIVYGWFTQGRERLRQWSGLALKHTGLILAGYVFLWINVDVLRVVHHWAGIGWDFSLLLQADVTQTLLSLLWSVMGLAGTFYAARINQRQLWIVSAVLLAVVVLKLFAIDLSAQNTIERIVSFIGVGLLLTFVGYFSPIPPRQQAVEAES